MGIGVGSLLAVACVLPPGSAGDDDDGTGSTATAGPSVTTDSSPGMTSAGMSGSGSSDDGVDDGSGTTESSGGEPGCPEPGQGGLPGVNPGAVWVPTFDFPVFASSTVTKFDAETMTPTAQYYTRQFQDDNPAQVAVNLSGDVVVSDHAELLSSGFGGGLTKFYGDLDDCIDANGDGVITTSAGAGDLLAWDDEECRAWFLPLDYQRQYSASWVPGVWNEQTCQYDDEEVWSLGLRPVGDAAVEMEVILVDGDTGTILDTAILPEFELSYGKLYSTAVDADGNYWTFRRDTLTRIDRQTLDIQTWPTPIVSSVHYGMTVGPSGYVFLCGDPLARFDPATQTWETANDVARAAGGGCFEDGQGRLWVPNPSFGDGVTALDVTTLMPVDGVALPHAISSLGFDFSGRLWAFSGSSTYSDVFRVDLATGTLDTFEMMSRPIDGHLSDLTGFSFATLLAP